jgi:DNA polymerase elongation subunit (family B)
MNFYLYSISTTRLRPSWSEEIQLHCCDPGGKNVILSVRDFRPYLLFAPRKQAEVCDLRSSDLDVDHMNRSCFNNVESLQFVHRTKFIGPSLLREKQKLIEVRLQHWGVSRKVRSYVVENNFVIGDPDGIAVHVDPEELHVKIKPHVQFLHEANLRLFSWISLQTVCLPHPNHHAQIPDCYSVSMRDLYPAANQDEQPTLTTLVLRLHAHSSTATRTNCGYGADASKPHDRIRCIATAIIRKDEVLHTALLVGKKEVHILQKLKNLIAKFHVVLFVQSTDGEGDRSDLLYLHRRSLLYPKLCFSLSTLFADNEFSFNKKTYFNHPGRERLNLVDVLHKFMVTPEMDGYTLMDALHHPKLIKDKSAHTSLADPRYDTPNTFSPDSLVEEDARLHCALMCSLLLDNGFLHSQAALAHSCDLNMIDIVEKGQQVRVYNCLARKLVKHDVYINHRQLETPFLVVKKTNLESSFPEPPWLPNPASLRPLDEEEKGGGSQKTTSAKKKQPGGGGDLLAFMDHLSRAQENRLRRAERAKKKKKKDKNKKAFLGGFVVPTVPAFYVDPKDATATLDFSSLYPSIIVGYYLCYQCVCFDRAILTDDRATLMFISLDEKTCCVFVTHYDGVRVDSITNLAMAEIMENRKRIRAKMKTTTDPFVLASLDAAQLSAKVLQNGTYGFLGSPTSGLMCGAMAASVTALARYQNKTMRHLAISKYGCRCVGGDTDSIFVQFPTTTNTRDEIFEEIYAQANKLAVEATTLFPDPNSVDFETVKSPFLLPDKKKIYTCIHLSPEDGSWKLPGKIVMKGLSIKKRDRCQNAQKNGTVVNTGLLMRKNDNEILRLFEKELLTFNSHPRNIEELLPYVITTALGVEYKTNDALGPTLASLIQQESGERPLPNRRIPYVVVCAKSHKVVDRVRTVKQYLKSGESLDIRYYLLTQTLLPLKQVLSLPVHQPLYKRVEVLVRKFCEALELKRLHQPELMMMRKKKKS